jgi:hypothetical protein
MYALDTEKIKNNIVKNIIYFFIRNLPFYFSFRLFILKTFRKILNVLIKIKANVCIEKYRKYKRAIYGVLGNG